MSNIPKKRGRKPKGGKIVESSPIPVVSQQIFVENIILHLNCHKSDIQVIDDIDRSIHTITPFEPESSFTEIEHISEERKIECSTDKINKTITSKLSELEKNLHTNNIQQTSNCFWCTCGFDTPAIFIPSGLNNNKYNVYGCFCSPECAASHLFEEKIEDTVKYERYHLLNYIYGKIYEYNVSIKLAPSPYYLLDKYYGNLTIQEFRQLLTYERLFLVTNKPLTKVYPELHEDNINFEPLYTNKLFMKPVIEVDTNNKMNEVFNYR
jgi:hypothetical protein